MTRRPVVERRFNAFHDGPASVRSATRLIVVATVFTTVSGGLLVWLFDRHDFPNIGTAMWWSLQTVTTVGYGDVTPKNGIGRIIGAAVLLYAVAFLTILTAAVTTTFIEQARRQRASQDEGIAGVIARLDDVTARLDRLEQLLVTREGAEPPSA